MPASGAVRRLAAGCLLMPIFYTLLAVCAVFYSGSTAAGIVAPVFVLFLPMLAGLLPETLQSAVILFLPSSAVHTLSGVAKKGVREYTGIPPPFSSSDFGFLQPALQPFEDFAERISKHPALLAFCGIRSSRPSRGYRKGRIKGFRIHPFLCTLRFCRICLIVNVNSHSAGSVLSFSKTIYLTKLVNVAVSLSVSFFTFP